MAVKEESSKVIYTLNATAERFPIPFDTEKDDYGDAKNIAVYLGTVMLERGKDFLVESDTVIYKDAVNHGGEQLTVLRNTPVKQDIDFVDNGSFSLEDIEKMGDNAVRILQEIKTNLGDTINAQFSAARAAASATAAALSASGASASATAAMTSEANAEASASNARASEVNAKTSEDNAASSAASASTSAGTATAQAGIATDKAEEASTSATSAALARSEAESARDSAQSFMNEAKDAESRAAASAERVGESAHDSEAYAVGTRGGTPVSSTDKAFNNNSKYYHDMIKQQITGGVRYKGVFNAEGATDFSAIPLPVQSGDMFRVSGSSVILGYKLNTKDYILFNKDIPVGSVISAEDVDHFDNTEPAYVPVTISGEYEDGEAFSFELLTSSVSGV